ncbi:hypothetical protein BHE74_00023463 [Ensete ventricosum]|uniref:Uncharacterized protein n=1 Tax=Ensete ventricosum TaxID=4639 RepID=A0A444FPV8_ENSVE|nr:hypothetical protein B296_00004180 [Ensete ventricosum]RWW24670.1 hypothetical protein GW17_00011024 [Ensete ventricosum]RWW68973.1 hypothetical protein BHE74_00023463 [Ensete ventricosum]RZR76614.1 hypothetical protein BHM03_00001456 [Ensete ventricosum]
MIQQSVPVVSSDRRLADHFGGKLHLGYMLIREKLAELQYFTISCFRAKNQSRDRDRAGSKDQDVDKEVHVDNQISGREFDRRNKDHDPHYDRGLRDGDRDSDRSRSYDSRSRRPRSCSRDRGRDYDRHR